MIQFKIRTEYTFGRAYAPIDKVIAHLKSIGCTAAGCVDLKSTWAHVKWVEACEAAGIKPMLGVELAVGESEATMWFLARNASGLSELYRASSRAHQQMLQTKFGGVPRLHHADVLSMSDDILKFAGALLDEKLLVDCGAVIDISPASRVLNHAKRELAQRHGLKTVNISDNAYVAESDKAVFELINDAGLKPTPQHILGELLDTPDALELAATISTKLPKAPMIRAEGNLEQLCRVGIVSRGMTEIWTDAYEQRLLYELRLIKEKDFESYFLVVADMVNFAKQHMLVGPSRGSAAGSLACYLARITEIDPMPPGLFFERFIDVSRSDLPDIDLDFPDAKREMVFEYMAKKYGQSNTAHIGTVSRFQPRSALIQVCKKLNIPPQATGGVKAAMIVRSSADSRANNQLLDTLQETEPGKKLVEMYPQVLMATHLEGHASHTGTHAAGLLVCNAVIQDFCTVDANGIAQVEYKAAEKLGLLKIDVLGLRTLGILEDTGINIDWYGLQFDDDKTYGIFNSQRFCGIFQFEGNAMRAVSREIEFSSLTDIDAVTALARPGPFGGGVTEKYIQRRKGAEYKPVHPLVEAHMKQSYGLPIYQEQTLAIVREIGKFDWKDTSTIRKAMSKRMGKEFFDTFWIRFREGALSQGISEQEARETWELINAMGAWQMNKAHTYSYAVISYWCAYLKANHPLEFAAANLRHAKDDDSALLLLREMVKEGVQYVRFDPLLSEETWSIKDGKLVAGYNALKGFGDSKSKDYVDARKAGKLTQEMINKALAAEDMFDDIFPLQTKYGHLYTNPGDNGIMGKVLKCDEIDGTQDGSVVFLGKLIRKNPRNENEDVNVKKRGGRKMSGPLDFLDITLADDTGSIMARVNRYKYQVMGKPLVENVPLDAVLLVRAHFKAGIRFGFIDRWKRLDEPEVKQ